MHALLTHQISRLAYRREEVAALKAATILTPGDTGVKSSFWGSPSGMTGGNGSCSSLFPLACLFLPLFRLKGGFKCLEVGTSFEAAQEAARGWYVEVHVLGKATCFDFARINARQFLGATLPPAVIQGAPRLNPVLEVIQQQGKTHYEKVLWLPKLSNHTTRPLP